MQCLWAALGEFAIMMMLAWRHRLFDIATSFRQGSWSWSPMVGGAVRGEIGGQTVGVVGLGHIGREVAWRAAGLGCRVLAVNRTKREKPASVEHVFSWTELDRMLGECDIVVLSCALTRETTGLPRPLALPDRGQRCRQISDGKTCRISDQDRRSRCSRLTCARRNLFPGPIHVENGILWRLRNSHELTGFPKRLTANELSYFSWL